MQEQLELFASSLGADLNQAWTRARGLLRALVAEEFADAPTAGLDVVEELWWKNKCWLLRYFGPDGRVSVQVADYLSEYDAYERFSYMVQDFAPALNSLCSRKELTTLREMLWQEHGLSLDSVTASFFRNLRQIFPSKALVNGRLVDPLPMCDGSQRTYGAGTRMSRVLLSYLHAGWIPSPLSTVIRDHPELTKLVDDLLITVYSQLISHGKLTPATVVLSVNPVDLLLVSTHTENWRSCHNIVDGQWRTGPLAYLIDKVSAVAYAYVHTRDFSLKEWRLPVPEGVDSVIPAQPVKLWRQMVYFWPRYKMVLQSREYPGAMAAFADEVERLAGTLMAERLGSPQGSWRTYRRPSVKFSRPKVRLHYPDWPERGLFFESRPLNHPATVRVGISKIPCLVCGNPREDGDHHHFVCEPCRLSMHQSVA